MIVYHVQPLQMFMVFLSKYLFLTQVQLLIVRKSCSVLFRGDRPFDRAQSILHIYSNVPKRRDIIVGVNSCIYNNTFNRLTVSTAS